MTRPTPNLLLQIANSLGWRYKLVSRVGDSFLGPHISKLYQNGHRLRAAGLAELADAPDSASQEIGGDGWDSNPLRPALHASASITSASSTL